MREECFTDGELAVALEGLPGLELEDGSLVRTFKHSEFLEGIAFVQKVAELAEEENHHPDIDIRYRRVKLALVTHSAGGITEKDVSFARKLALDD